MHLTERQIDGQTDRQTEFSLLDRICIPSSEVKTKDVTMNAKNMADHREKVSAVILKCDNVTLS